MRRLVPCPDCQRHVRATETTCPHCGRSSGALGFAAIAMTAGLALAGCDRPPVAPVYGPPAIEPTARVDAPIDSPTTTTTMDAPTAVTAVYGPAPVRPEDRVPPVTPTANPTATSSATTTPTAAPKPTSPAQPEPVNVPIYGPAPRSPDLRAPDKK